MSLSLVLAAQVVLLQFSDLHGDAVNLQRVVDYVDTCSVRIDDAIHCGDAVSCYWDEVNPWDVVRGARSIINVVGNHDCWKGHLGGAQTDHPYDASIADAYDKIMVGRNRRRPFIRDWGVVQDGQASTWFHKDYDGLRVVFLDALHYTREQDAWLGRVLDDALSLGLTVVAVSHYQPQLGLEKLDCGFSSRLEDCGPVPDPGSSQMERLPDAAYEAVDAFLDRGGQFACWLCGHTHLDMIGFATGHPRQFVITVDKAGEKDQYMQEDRTRGTAFQDSFNIISLDGAAGWLSVRRVGCNVSEDGRQKTGFSYNWLTGEVSVEVPNR